MRQPSGLADQLRAHSTGLDVRPLRLDVTDDDSVAAAVREVEQSVGSLDVLFNTAGIPGTWAPAAEVGPADFTSVFEINVLGPVRVTQAFLPLLLHGERPRLVMVSSGMGSFTRQTTDDDYFPDRAPAVPGLEGRVEHADGPVREEPS